MSNRTRTRALFVAVAAAVSGIGIVQSAHAVDLYWDINGTDGGAVGDGVAPGVVTGMWDTTTTNWNTDSTGGAGGTVQAWADGNTAVFSAGTNGTLASTITLDGTRTIAGLNFEEGQITLAGTAGVAILAMTGDTTFTSNSSLLTTIAPKITGTGRVTKEGAGKIRFIPNQATTPWTGGTQFNAGAWEIAGDGGLGVAPATVAAGANNMIFNGGTLNQGNGVTSITINPNRRIVVNAAGATFDANSTGSWIYNGDGLQGTGTITKRGNNQLLVFGASNVGFTGKYNVLGGDIQSNQGNDTGLGAVPDVYTADAITLNGGGIRHGPTDYAISANRGITLGAGGGVLRSGNNANNTMTINSVITGPGSLTRSLFILNTSNSTVILNGANDYTGGTVVEAGILTANGASALGATTGTLGVFNVNTAFAGTSVVLNLSSTAPTTTGSLSGAILMPASGTNTATINTGAGQLFTVNQTTSIDYQGTIAGTGGFRLGSLSNATLTLTGNNTYTGGTTVEAGALVVNRLHGLAADGTGTPNPVAITGGTLQVAESSPTIASGHPGGNNAFVSRPGSMITIANNGGDIVSLNPTTLSPRIYNGTLDLTNNDLVIDYDGASPIADVEDMIRAGRNGGAWNGKGIISSTAGSIAAAGAYTLGLIDNATPGITPFTTFSDQTVDTTTVLVKFVHRSDINMDGVVTFSDSVRFNGNYSEGTPTRWVFGDLNYNGISDFGDSVLFNGGYDEALASLPEPGSLALFGLVGLAAARRRRARSA